MQDAIRAQTIFLHIGTEKTGTTTIQTLASQNRELLVRNGLFYPRTPGDTNHVGLTLFASGGEARHGLPTALKLRGDAEISEYVGSFAAKLEDEIRASGATSILLSNEHLSARLRKPASISRLFELLRQIADSIKIIVYLRPQHELLLSAYSTSVKSGSTKPLQIEKTGREHLFNYDKMLRLWENVAGIDSIDVRLFSRTEFAGGSLIEDFFQALGLARPAGLVIPSDRNRALDGETLDFLRIANRTLPRIIDGEIDHSRQSMMSALEKISRGPLRMLSLQEQETIYALYAGSNLRVAARYFALRAEPIFPAPVRSSTTGASALTVERAVEIGAMLWRECKPRGRRDACDAP